MDRRQKLIYILHLLMVFLALTGWFLISWQWIVPVYIIVILQFWLFGTCLVNRGHGLIREDATFYSDIFWKLNIQHNHQTLKIFVRRYLYWVLAICAIIWQVVFKQPPLIF